MDFLFFIGGAVVGFFLCAMLSSGKCNYYENYIETLINEKEKKYNEKENEVNKDAEI